MFPRFLSNLNEKIYLGADQFAHRYGPQRNLVELEEDLLGALLIAKTIIKCRGMY